GKKNGTAASNKTACDKKKEPTKNRAATIMCIFRFPIMSKYIRIGWLTGRATLSISFISHSSYVYYALSIHRQLERNCLFMTMSKQNVSTLSGLFFFFSK